MVFHTVVGIEPAPNSLKGLKALNPAINFPSVFTTRFHFNKSSNPFFILLRFLLIGCCLLPSISIAADTTAKVLFSDLKKWVYQIRVIDVASGDKYSIGSGFLVSEEGHIATNFHVVSSYVHDPDKYRLEFTQHDGTTLPVSLLAIDVVHDLAIVKSNETGGDYLKLSTETLHKGNRIYSMGNPRDLGMTIIEGTYNGLVKNSRYRKILFSGSLNPGMSGGPTINEHGDVIGVNVSKGGEQISFLVPVMHVEALLDQAINNPSDRGFKSDIRAALFEDQQQFYQTLLSAPLDMQPLGELLVPGKLSESLRCWGHTVDEEDIKYEAVHRHCKSEDEIYISNNFFVGNFFYDYEWITTEELNRFQFYSFLQSRFSHNGLRSAYSEEDITEYRCHDRFLTTDAGSWKVSSCFRAYKDYEGLYDALLLMASVEENDKAAIFKAGASGVSSDNALAFFQRMMEAIQWKR